MSSPYGPPPAPWSGGAPAPGSGSGETSTKAVVALVLAVLAYTPAVPFIGAIAALLVARSAEGDIVRSGGATSGLGLVRAARVLAWVHLVLVALLFVLIAAVFVLPFSSALVP